MAEYTVRFLMPVTVKAPDADAAVESARGLLSGTFGEDILEWLEPDGDDSVDGPEDVEPAPVKSVQDALRDVLARLKDLGYEVPDA